MDPFVFMEWSGAERVVANPATVGRAWRLEELEALGGDEETCESEPEVYGLGYRWCVCFSPFTPEAETGYLPHENLLALTDAELDAARTTLTRGWDAFGRALDALVVRAGQRLV